MKTLIEILKSRQFILYAGFLLLIFLIWFMGGLFGVSQNVRLIAIIGVLAVAIIVLVLEQARASRNANQLEQSLRMQAEDQKLSVRPEKREEIEQLQQQLTNAIGSLKKSKLAKGVRGSQALYTLPWYMMIGPPAAGKTTAIKNSGLDFPFGADREIQGMGGTRNCDWWFSNSAILLDTAGRYMTEDEDREEWFAFLDILKKHRRRQPINGVIIGISIVDLINSAPDEREWHANKIRKRMDELMQRLGIRFPVYLVFTKCDLINGFTEFFGEFSRKQREQVWGCTFSQEQLAHPTPKVVFEEEFERLYESLLNMRLNRLGTNMKREKRRGVYAFPLEFLAAKETLSYFIGRLWQPNPYQENPVFRGFYFTSGTQEGVPIDRVIESVAKAFGLSRDVTEQFNPEIETKAYFIKELMTDVVIPDQGFVGSTSRSKYAKWIRAGSIAAMAVALVGFIAGTGISYVNSGNRLEEAGNHLSDLRRDRQSGFDLKYFENLDNLRAELTRLNDSPLFSFGMDRSDKMLAPTCRLYFEKLDPFVKKHLYEFLESRLGASTYSDSAKEELYDLLKTYLLLGNERKQLDDANKSFLSSKLYQSVPESFPTGNTDELQPLVKRQLDFFLNHLNDDGDKCKAPAFVNDANRITRSRDVIRQLGTYIIVYKRVLSGAGEIQPMGVSSDLFDGEKNIRGVFTKTGWEKINDLLKKDIESLASENWVLADQGVVVGENDDKLKQAVLTRYYRDYTNEWMQLLWGVRVRQFTDVNEARSGLKKLGDSEQSSIAKLLRQVSEQTDLQGDATGFFEKTVAGVEKKLGVKTTLTPVEQKFAGLHSLFANEGKDLNALLAQFASVGDELQKLQDDPAQVRAFADKTFKGNGGVANPLKEINTKLEKVKGNPPLRDALVKMFEEPLYQTWTAFLKYAQEYLNKGWKEKVADVYSEELGKQFPFNPNATESAQPQKISEFFKDAVGEFVKSDLGPFIQDEKSLEPRTWQGLGGIQLSKAAREAVSHGKAMKDFSSGFSFAIKYVSHQFTKGDSEVDEVCFSIGNKDECSSTEKGKSSWKLFPFSPSQVATVRLQRKSSKFLVFGHGEGIVAEKKEEGDWAWLKLHWQATPLLGARDGEQHFQLKLVNPEEEYEVLLRYAIRSSDAAKFAKGAMSFNCPPQLN